MKSTSLFCVVLLACGPVVGVEGGSTDGIASTAPVTTFDPDSNTGGITTATSSASSDSGEASSISSISVSEGEDIGDSDDGSSFIQKFDIVCFAHCPPWRCDVWDQDCGDDEKCVPWANDGGDTWTDVRCAPVDPAPALIGQPCLAQGNGVSGIDDCEAGAFCWGVDPTTLEGTCVAMCTGSQAQPLCPEGLECVTGFDGNLNVCATPCDPLERACGDDGTCAILDTAASTFACLPTPAFVTVEYGAPCENASLSICGTGLVCLGAQHVPGCIGEACCSLLGDLASPPACPDITQSCLPFAENMPDLCVCGVAG
jgi:hypothetical protein